MKIQIVDYSNIIGTREKKNKRRSFNVRCNAIVVIGGGGGDIVQMFDIVLFLVSVHSVCRPFLQIAATMS